MAVAKGEVDIARLFFRSHPHRPTDLQVPEASPTMAELVAHPPPFKISPLKRLCWVQVRRDVKLERKAAQQEIPEFV